MRDLSCPGSSLPRPLTSCMPLRTHLPLGRRVPICEWVPQRCQKDEWKQVSKGLVGEGPLMLAKQASLRLSVPC